MKKMCYWGALAGVALLAVGAQAQMCPMAAAGADDELLEQLLILRFAKDCDISDYSMTELMQGYEEYKEGMSALKDKRAQLAKDLQAAADAGKASSEISSLLNSLMDADRQILEANQSAVNEAGSLLTPAQQAKLYLMVADLGAAKRALVAAMVGMPCPMRAAAAPAAAEAAVPAAPAVSDQDLVKAAVKSLVDAVMAKNINGILATLSEDFYHPEVGDKTAIGDLAQQGFDMIDMSSAKIDTSGMQVKIEGDEAEAYPIEASADMGSVTVSLTLKKEDGKWLITTGDAEGI